MGDLFRKHPELIGALFIAVALLAYFASRSGGGGGTSSDDITFTGGGVASRAIDPSVAAIEQSRIDAGTRNLSTVAQLYLGLTQSADQLEAYQTGTSAALESDLARTSSGERVSLAGIEAQRTIGLSQIASSVDLAHIYSAADLEAARITGATQQAIAQSNIELERQRLAQQEKLTLEQQATERDIARVKAKSDFWDSAFGTIGDVVSAFNPFNWF